MDRDIPSSYAYANPGVYKTGFTNSQLDKLTVGLWILNACVFSAIFCMMFFLVLEPTFEAFDLFEMGTVIYIGLVLSLQLKVSFLHQVWNYIHVLAMAISVVGIFVVIYIISLSIDQYDYYGVVGAVYSRAIFWFFGVFSIPLTCVLIDFTAYSLALFFFPPDEAVFREAAFGMYMEAGDSNSIGKTPEFLHLGEARFEL
jgi:magnesium-transporting ATPase (P-type)